MDLSDLVQQLKSEDSQLRRAAAELLSQQPEIGHLAITDLVRACADDDEVVCQYASRPHRKIIVGTNVIALATRLPCGLGDCFRSPRDSEMNCRTSA